MKTKFQVGDRVAVYGATWEQHGKYAYLPRQPAKLDREEGSGFIAIDEDGWEAFVMPEQCRRLKPKKKPEVIEFETTWVRANVGMIAAPEGFGNHTAFQVLGKRTRVRIEVLDD